MSKKNHGQSLNVHKGNEGHELSEKNEYEILDLWSPIHASGDLKVVWDLRRT